MRCARGTAGEAIGIGAGAAGTCGSGSDKRRRAFPNALPTAVARGAKPRRDITQRLELLLNDIQNVIFFLG